MHEGSSVYGKRKVNIDYLSNRPLLDKGGVYILLLVGNGEFFLKIGRTRKFRSRFKDIAKSCGLLDYKIYVVKLVVVPFCEAVNLEGLLLNNTRPFKHHPKKYWDNGFTECREVNIEVISELKNIKLIDENDIVVLRDLYAYHRRNNFATEIKRYRYKQMRHKKLLQPTAKASAE